jgi:hypothetical protein
VTTLHDINALKGPSSQICESPLQRTLIGRPSLYVFKKYVVLSFEFEGLKAQKRGPTTISFEPPRLRTLLPMFVRPV